MKISIFGTGYVGLVTGACMADVGNDVVCVDIDAAKVARLDAGEIPIFEPGLEDIVAANRAKKRRLSSSPSVRRPTRMAARIFRTCSPSRAQSAGILTGPR
jgi:UDP-glucose 6-dehydrogenase